jgi:hypothetical protein
MAKTLASTAILGICHVVQPKFKADGSPDGTNEYYFQSSTIYHDVKVAAATGISYIDPDNWTGQEPLIKVEELIRTNKIERRYAELENPTAGKPNKVIGLLITPDKAITVKAKGPGLIDLDLSTVRGGVTTNLGKCFGIRNKTRDVFR